MTVNPIILYIHLSTHTYKMLFYHNRISTVILEWYSATNVISGTTIHKVVLSIGHVKLQYITRVGRKSHTTNHETFSTKSRHKRTAFILKIRMGFIFIYWIAMNMDKFGHFNHITFHRLHSMRSENCSVREPNYPFVGEICRFSRNVLLSRVDLEEENSKGLSESQLGTNGIQWMPSIDCGMKINYGHKQ